MRKHKKTSNKNVLQTRWGIFAPSALYLRVLAGVALVVVATVIAYIPSLNGGFVLDDDQLLTESNIIKAPDGLCRFWFTTEATDYWPVTNNTLWIEWRLWGMNSTGYHVTNLILHIVESLLIWIILRRMSIPGAFLAAMIFAVHPVNVESVAWIASRKNMIAMLFFLLSIMCYLKVEMPSQPPRNRLYSPGAGRWYWLSLFAFLLAMLGKGSVAFLPVLLLWIVWRLRPLTRWDLLRSAPFFVIAIGLAVVNMWFQTHGSGEVFRTAGFVERLLGAGSAVWFYLYKSLLPFNLALVYSPWHVQVGNLLWWLPMLAALIVTIVFLWYRAIWSRQILFAWGYFCLALAPVMGFSDVGFMRYSLVADRYQHIAIIGVIALGAAGFNAWHKRTSGMKYLVTIIIAIMSMGSLAFLTRQQSSLYRNAFVLYKATLKLNPECWMINTSLGFALDRAGRPLEAIENYKQALRLKLDYLEAYINLGAALAQIGRTREAIDNYEQALRLKPDHPEAHYNLGHLYDAMGQYEKAIEHYEKAVKYKPNFAYAHNNLGFVLVKTGRSGEAFEHFKQAVQLKPDYVSAYNNLALAYTNMHQPSEAIAMAEKALELARSQGQTEMAKQIEEWLNLYRASLVK